MLETGQRSDSIGRTVLGDRLYAIKPLSVSPFSPVCDVGVLWPKGWMRQDETWHGDQISLGHGHIALDGDPAPPAQKGHTSNFRPMSVVAKQFDG